MKLQEFYLLYFGECCSINLLKLSNFFKSLINPCFFISLSKDPYPAFTDVVDLQNVFCFSLIPDVIDVDYVA